MNKKELEWNEIRKSLDFTEEEEIEIQLEKDIIQAVIDARKKSQLTQRELSKKSGIKQPSIAKIETCSRSPQITTLIKLLYPMGYTIRVVPLKENKKS